MYSIALPAGRLPCTVGIKTILEVPRLMGFGWLGQYPTQQMPLAGRQWFSQGWKDLDHAFVPRKYHRIIKRKLTRRHLITPRGERKLTKHKLDRGILISSWASIMIVSLGAWVQMNLYESKLCPDIHSDETKHGLLSRNYANIIKWYQM